MCFWWRGEFITIGHGVKGPKLGSEFCGLAKGLAIQGVKSLTIEEKTLQIVIYSPKPKVPDKRNRSALQKTGTEA